jgi:Tfp pilus assembly protein PilO
MTPKKMNLFLKITLLVIVVFVMAGLFFADSVLEGVAKNNSRLKAEVEITNKKLENYEVTKAKIDELGYVEDLAKEILPQNENQSIVVAELAEFAQRANLATGSITFVEEVDSKNKAPVGVKIIPVKFTVSKTASYQDVLDFLKSIEENRRKMQVTQISLTPDSEDGNKLEDVSLTLNLFVRSSGAKKGSE